jgi:4-diphosphocytidyl-2-C-methyl-D-erythritol kinase
MDEIVETARAKINLTLRVHGRRADGYHELESLVTFADIGDHVRLLPHASGPQPDRAPRLEVVGPFAGDIVGENLVETALRRIADAAGLLIAADLELEKNVPVASGIGGGSADAAAALRAVRRLLGGKAAGVDWETIAHGLGADVPVCLASRPAVMTGTGENLRPVALPPLDVVLANAGEPMPPDKTRLVFQALAAPPLAGAPISSHDSVPLDRDGLIRLMRAVGNDLERPATALFPALREVADALLAEDGCEIAVLSGAGPTVVGVYSSAAAARAAAQALQRARPAWWVRAAATVAG